MRTSSAREGRALRALLKLRGPCRPSGLCKMVVQTGNKFKFSKSRPQASLGGLCVKKVFTFKNKREQYSPKWKQTFQVE